MVLKVLLVVLLMVSTESFASDELTLSKKVLDASQMTQLSHIGSGRFGSYLTMDIPFDPVKDLVFQLNASLGEQLTNRGEAHITVITPVEYFDVLKAHISMEEIDKIAERANIQSSSFEVVCIGRGQVKLESQQEQTYYIVVQSSDLISIRQKVFEKYVANGGEPSLFDPQGYYPHITLGFTKRDLHESDGVKKGTNSCYQNVTLK